MVGLEKKIIIKSVKNLIKKHYHIKMLDICNKIHMKIIYFYNSLHLPVSDSDLQGSVLSINIAVQNIISGLVHSQKLITA